MRDLFLDDGPDMEQGSQTLTASAPHDIRDALAGRFVCPFCGIIKDQAEATCPRCAMENTPATRQATKSRIGPWYVLQGRNPAAPGMKFDTLMTFIRKGRVKPRSIVRGPTTHQLWRFAAHVKGLSREFGVCYSCGGAIDRTGRLCPHCNRPQEPPENPDSFVEGQESSASGSIPVFRDLGAPPLVAEDIVRPSDRGSQPSTAAEAHKPGPRNAGDGFLSAQDLAAAFKLNFQHRGEKPARSAGPAEPADQPSPRRRPTGRRKRRRGRVLIFLVLLGLLGVFAFEYQHDAGVRTRSQQWLGTAMAWSRQKWTDLMARPAPKPPVRAQSDWNKLLTEPPKEKAPQGRSAATSPADKPDSSSQPSRPDWDKLFNGEQSAASGPPAANAAAPPRQRHQDDNDDLWTLYRGAIDDEARGDYAAAVKKYEQIKEFSPDLWPRDVQLRLKEARRQAGQ